jgi:hypothetical protein
VNYKSSDEKCKKISDKSNYFVADESKFEKIPGKLYAYWIDEGVSKAFEEYPALRDLAAVKNGMSTTNNNKFVRWWFECSENNIAFSCANADEAIMSQKKWFPYNKGGEYRKWYGNIGLVVNWENNGQEIKKAAEGATGGRIVSQDYYFMRSVSWSKVSSGRFALRMFPKGFLFDVAGPGIFCDYETQKYIMGVINSNLKQVFLQELYPTMNYEMGQVSSFPILIDDLVKKDVSALVENNIILEKEDWDNYETSWDFRRNVLVTDNKQSIEKAYSDWCVNNEEMIEIIRENEEKLNKLFINLYGLNDTLSYRQSREEVTVKSYDLGEDIKSLLSYAVGCIMGRYSLKEEGLIYAGGELDDSKYSDDFRPCEYGIMPITDEQFFEEDLCTRVIDFIKVVYGEDTLSENLKFIAKALNPNSYEAPRKIIRDYLFNDFFDNHYQIYQHRPIYWQLDSGKAGGFKAILYMHRYNENTLSIVRTEYIQELRYKYEDEMQRLQRRHADAKTTAERNAVKKEITALDRKIVECSAYDELLNHVTGNIHNYSFDLDDGVKTNYAKFLSIDGDKNKNILTVIKL